MMRKSLSAVVLASVVVMGLGLWQRAMAQESKYPHMHVALHNLREAKAMLKKSDHKVGGHLDAALSRTQQAIDQMEEGMKDHGGVPAAKPVKGPKGDGPHPYLKIALYHLRVAKSELTEGNREFGKHREEALKQTQMAILNTEKAIATK